MKSQEIDIKKIKVNPSNPRTIKDENFKKLVQSIQEFPEMLDIRPIVVSKDMAVTPTNSLKNNIISAQYQHNGGKRY